MAKPKPKPRATKITLDSYTIKRTKKIIKPGDCVLMRPPKPSKPSYVAKIETIESIGSQVKVHVQWYYRPEEAAGGRRRFHGMKELFLSDHRDVQSADTIEGKCTVHSFRGYTSLRAVGNDDFFCRFEYKSSARAFSPNKVAVYCKCNMPYNPDELMVQCDGCIDWFHPRCIGMSSAEAKHTDHFLCETCLTEEQELLQNSLATSPHGDAKVGTKRRWDDAKVKEEIPDAKIKKEEMPDAEVKEEEMPDAEVKVKKEEPDV
ncbi:chromatin remodeling protein SHL-like [Bidens hawaiensis]|uniref:chromatin remodeling protein SHL-like n=1 Tax=Bidens hawaiensis TaxID=980011 RepID=UPI00404AFA44